MESYFKNKNNYVKRTMSKKESMMKHARKRCEQRVGLKLNDECYSFVLRAIHGEKIEGIKLEYKLKQSTRVDHYVIQFGNMKEKYDVVYDNERDVIVTFLPFNEGQIFFQYTNWIGNAVNLKSQHGIVLKMDKGELTGNHVDIEKINNDTWYVKDIDKTLQLRNGRLYEI